MVGTKWTGEKVGEGGLLGCCKEENQLGYGQPAAPITRMRSFVHYTMT